MRGVSLIEALLALVVMSLGMLAVVGVQATLRSNGDLSRQRAEAVRLAQQDIENLRAFSSVTAGAGRDFTDIVAAGPDDVTPAGANAVYRLIRTVPDDPPNGSPPFRTVGVSVQWTDRAGTAQQVQLFTGVARIAPAISASLSVPPNGGPARQPLGRHAAIPRGAVTQSDGTSTFTPPQATGAGTTSLVFSNLTGLITKICTTTTDGTTTCIVDKAQLVTGFIRAAIKPTYPNPLVISNAEALNPQSTMGHLGNFLGARSLGLTVQYTSSSSAAARTGPCFSDPLLAGTDTALEYFCVVRLYADPDHLNPTWTGSLKFGPESAVGPVDAVPAVITNADTANQNSDSLLRVCRYKPASASYAAVTGPLTNQNFLLVAAGSGTSANSCPAAVTAAHQPAS
jgi:Tfp pilus assembly protein PilX